MLWRKYCILTHGIPDDGLIAVDIIFYLFGGIFIVSCTNHEVGIRWL